MADAHEMACRELVQLVSDYLDAYLTEADRQRFDEHLAVCSGCVTIVEQFRATIAMTGATAPPGRRRAHQSSAQDRA